MKVQIQEHPRTALVLGATGGIGSETASALARRGWTIRAMSRSGTPAINTNNWQWVKGDVMNASTVADAAAGTQVIVHAVNPANYGEWNRLVLPMIDNTIHAAKLAGARILLPGTIYNYGTDAFPVLFEDSPQHASTHKGKIRIEMEKRLQDAAKNCVNTLIVRFGDFFGPRPGHSWFSQAVVKPNKPLQAITYPGKAGVGHNWAYLPDCGEAFARLLDHESELEPFARYHFRGHWDNDGTEIIAAIQQAAGSKNLPVKTFPWWFFHIASPFNNTMKEFLKPGNCGILLFSLITAVSFNF